MANKYLEKIADEIQNHPIGAVGTAARAVGRSAVEGVAGGLLGGGLGLLTKSPGAAIAGYGVGGLAGQIHGAIKSLKNTNRKNALYYKQHPGV